MKIVLAILGFVVFVVALVFAARTFEPAVVATAPPPKIPRVVDAPEAPALPALFVVKNDVDQTPIALAGPRKKPLLLHLWASWCGPCVAELPSLLSLGRKGASTAEASAAQFDVVAVSVDDRWPDVVKFFSGKIPPEVVWDPKVTLEPTLGVRSLPTTFLVDGAGKVVATHIGALTAPQLQKLIDDNFQ